MTTDMRRGPGAFRRLMNKVTTWSEALNYSGIDYTLDRIAFIERRVNHYRSPLARARRCASRPARAAWLVQRLVAARW
jgi:hypothetical protein